MNTTVTCTGGRTTGGGRHQRHRIQRHMRKDITLHHPRRYYCSLDHYLIPWKRSRIIKTALSSLFYAAAVDANVAYPGIWTSRQPDGETTGIEQLLIGTPEYHFAVVETEMSFYPTLRGTDGTIHYASRGIDGRYLPTNEKVSINSNPDQNPFLQKSLTEPRHVVHAQCLENDYCKWRQRQDNSKNNHTQILVTSGTILNLVIPFQFADHAQSQRPLTATADLDQFLFNGPNLSVKHYIQQQSYGQLEVVSEVTPWVTIAYTEPQCANGVSGLSLTVHTCLQAALEQASQLLSDWETVLQSATTVTFVHSGYAAEFGGTDVDGRWYEDRIWSHAWEIDRYHHHPDDGQDNPSPLRYALISDKYDRKNAHMNRVGVAVHEFLQVLGAPTLYGDYPGYGLGYYDVMASAWGFDGTLTHCGSMSPYTKSLFGWTTEIEITSDGRYELTHSYDNGTVYVIRKGFPEGEYLLLENRQEEGYDKGLSQPGLAIYHIDLKAKKNNDGRTTNGSPLPNQHYRVALIQADGRYDLERMEDEGDSGDLFHGGRFTGVGPEGAMHRDGTTAVNTNGHPNTNSYQDGTEQRTGIVIKNISASDRVMTFDVQFT